MMTEEQPDETSPTDALRAAARALTTLRSRPCLFLSGEISRAQLLEVANALGERKGEALDLVDSLVSLTSQGFHAAIFA